MRRLVLKKFNNLPKSSDLVIGRDGSILRSFGFYETIVFPSLRPWFFSFPMKKFCHIETSADYLPSKGNVYKNAEIILRSCGFL